MRIPLHYDDSIQVTCSDSAAKDVNLPDVGYFAGFVPSTTGTVTFISPNQQSCVMNVIAGAIYAIPFVVMKVTGTSGTTGILGLIQHL